MIKSTYNCNLSAGLLRACLILTLLASLAGLGLAGASSATAATLSTRLESADARLAESHALPCGSAASLPVMAQEASQLESADTSLPNSANLNPADNPGVYYLEDVADSYVSAWESEVQHGDEPFLFVGHLSEFGYPFRFYLRFDHAPLPDDAVIQSATLHIYMHSQGYNDDTVRLGFHTVSEPWQESGPAGITWANQPDDVTYFRSHEVNAVVGQKAFDVTAAVRGWVSGDIENHGLMISAENEAGEWFDRGFHSREAAWCVPFIEVVYTTAGIPPHEPPRPPCGSLTDTVRTDLDIIVDPNPAFEGAPVQVTAVASDTVGIFQVRLVRSDLTVDHVVDETTPTRLEASDTVTLEPGNYRYTAWAQDAEHNWAFASVGVRVFHDGLAPRVWVEHQPAEPENGDTITFTARAEDESLIRNLSIAVNGLEHRFRIDPPEEIAEVTLDYDDTMDVRFLRYSASAWDLEDLSASTGTKYILFGNDGVDTDGDHLSDEIEEALGVDPEDNDTDDDGLYDHWEVLGYDADGDGVVDVDLPWMGATPYQKDVFWEMDWMVKSITETYAYQPEAIQATVNAYLDHGLHLHVDTGQYGGGEPLPYDDTRLRTGQNDGGAWYYEMKRHYFDCSRRGIFYYSAVTYGVDELAVPPVESNSINGSSFGSGHIYLINRSDTHPDSRARQTEILFHELGHGMGLGHGGQTAGDDALNTLSPDGLIERQGIDWQPVVENYKPHYLSVMNYQYQGETDLEVQTESGDRIYIYRYHTLPDGVLDERGLVESDGYVAEGLLGTYVWRKTTSASQLLHSVYEPASVQYVIWWGGEDFNASALADGSPIDWNRNAILESSIPPFDLNPNYTSRTITRTIAENEIDSLRPKIYGDSIFQVGDGCPSTYAVGSAAQEDDPHEDVSGELRTDGEYADGADNDGDGLIDEGFPDSDGDGIANAIDNCMLTFNPDQFDTDRNYLGDACESLPDAPANLGLRGDGGYVSVSWASSSNPNVIGYNVYRRLPDEDSFKRLGGDYPTTLETTSFRDDRCAEGAQYRVTAVDLYMKESAYSESAALAGGACRQAQPAACAGYAGLAIGVPNEDVSGAPNAGAINILYGSNGGLSDYRSQAWNQESPGVFGFSEENDRFGRSLAAGDFDGDTFSDLAVGSPWEAIGSVAQAGSVRILRGSLSGLGANDEDWTQDSPGVPDSSEAGDAFGHALVAGDFNGDGYEDLAIDAMGEGFGSAQRAGAVTVLYGSAGGLTASGSQQWRQDSPGVPGGSETGDLFGYSLAVGDFNRDGYADLAIGAPGEAIGDIPAAGSVRILYGSGGGLTATGADDFHQDIAGIPDEAEPDDEFGVALAAGDFDHDSYDDLAIGAPGESLLSSAAHAGAVTIVYGAAGGLSANGSQQWHQESPGIIGGSEPDDNFGEAVAAGDFNRDGYADLAVGVPGEAIGPRLAAGSIRILRGSSSGLTAHDETWSQESPGVVGESEAGDRFGLTLASGDFDDDGFADLAIGVPYEDLSTTEDAGAVRILRGSAGDLIGRNEDWNQGTSGVPGDPEPGDLFGLSLAAGSWCGAWHRVYLPTILQ